MDLGLTPERERLKAAVADFMGREAGVPALLQAAIASPSVATTAPPVAHTHHIRMARRTSARVGGSKTMEK
jgi:hypothetical protein